MAKKDHTKCGANGGVHIPRKLRGPHERCKDCGARIAHDAERKLYIATQYAR